MIGKSNNFWCKKVVYENKKRESAKLKRFFQTVEEEIEGPYEKDDKCLEFCIDKEEHIGVEMTHNIGKIIPTESQWQVSSIGMFHFDLICSHEGRY
jgi:hypothetical protein